MLPDRISSLRIERATVEQAALVREIMLAAFAELSGVLDPPSSAHRETVEDVGAAIEAGGALLAWVEDRAVGTARFVLRGEHIYVSRVGVVPGFRHHGIGSHLMQVMEDIACSLGTGQIQVATRASLHRNILLYQRLGYTLISVEPHPRGPDRVATLVKRLDPDGR